MFVQNSLSPSHSLWSSFVLLLLASLSIRTINFSILSHLFFLCGVHRWKGIRAGKCGGHLENESNGGALDRFKVSTIRKLSIWNDYCRSLRKTAPPRQFRIQGKLPRARPSTCNDFVQHRRVKVPRSRKFPETFLSSFRFQHVSLSVTKIRCSFSRLASVQLNISTSADVFLELFVCRRARFFLCYYCLCWEKLK